MITIDQLLRLYDTQILACAAFAISVILLSIVSDSNRLPMLQYIGSWFGSSHSSPERERRSSSSSSSHHKVRTRLQQQSYTQSSVGQSSTAGDSRSTADSVVEEDGYFPGVVNMSGTYCFLNSTLQALASLSYLRPQIDNVLSKAELWDVPTPVTDALRDILQELNTPQSHPKSIRPIALVNALSAPNPRGTRSRLFSSREHQDAQELFQLLSSMIQEEALFIDQESGKDTGLAAFDRVLAADAIQRREASKSVFEGLTANRRSCMDCGYTEAVMHFSFDNMTLPVPSTSTCTIEDCLKEYTHIEVLEDCICQKCSMVATLRKLTSEADRLSAPSKRRTSSSNLPTPNGLTDGGGSQGISTARKKRAREARKLQIKVQEALDAGSIEQEIKGVKLEKVRSSASTKQVMIARPPPVLALHLNRSNYFGHGFASKNSCRVLFPEILDLSAFTTSGALSTAPSAPISAHGPPPFPTTRKTQPPKRPTPILYRLNAVVCHYGAHSFGHYVSFRRKPVYKTGPDGARTVASPRLVDPVDCRCDKCAVFSPIREEYENDVTRPRDPLTGWLKISDTSVDEVGLERVLRESTGVFMLFYERVIVDESIEARDSTQAAKALEVTTEPFLPVAQGYGKGILDPGSPRSSEETITPENVMLSSPGKSKHSPTTPHPWSPLDLEMKEVKVEPEDEDPPLTPIVKPRQLPSQQRPPSRSSSTGSTARVVRNVFIPEYTSHSRLSLSMDEIRQGNIPLVNGSPTSAGGVGSFNTKYVPPSPKSTVTTPKLSSSLPILPSRAPSLPSPSQSKKVPLPNAVPYSPTSRSIDQQRIPSSSYHEPKPPHPVGLKA